MNIKINNSVGKNYNNSGSSSQCVSYLEKENEKKPTEEKEFFFNQEKEQVRADEVIKELDGLKKQGLSKDDAKFFHVVISPSSAELEAISNSPEKLKEYTNNCMNEYAKNFGKGLEGKDIVYFAKVEHERTYKGTDEEVKEKRAKTGDLKEGNNMHVHILVSRKDKSGKIKLSPLTNNKTTKGNVNGFNRDSFVQTCESQFDKQFNYNRERSETYEHCKIMQNGTAQERAAERLTIEQEQNRSQTQTQVKQIEQVQEQTKKLGRKL